MMAAAENPWRIALRALGSNPALLAGALAASAFATVFEQQGGVAAALTSLLYITLVCLLEMQFFGAALATWSRRPDPFWTRRRVAGFALRWAGLTTLFLVMPATAIGAALALGLVGFDADALARLLLVLIVLAWAAGYALLGSALPSFLLGRGGGFGAALRRPGFWARLRDLGSPAGLAGLALALYEAWYLLEPRLWTAAGDGLGALGVKAAQAAFHLPPDLLSFYAVALMAAILTREAIERGLDRQATIEAFE